MPVQKAFIKPSILASLPKNTGEAVKRVIEVLGPCSRKELKAIIGKRKIRALDWEKMVEDGELIKLNDLPLVLGLPGDEKYWSPLTKG